MSSFPLKVFGARMVVQVEKPDDVTVGGIVLLEASKEPSNKGTVVAVGEGIRLDNGQTFPIEVALGDVVLYPQFAGAPVSVEGSDESFVILNERDILAVIS